jgi:DNA polymerase-3 subunit alpha
MSFVHLHVHSHYSLLDGLGKPAELVTAAKQQGSPAIALTDHGVLYGAIEFYKHAKKEDIKPIIGVEAYIAPVSRFDKNSDPESKPFHLVLLAENNEGYENLLELVTKSHLEGFYYKPRMDFGLLKAHSKGLIASSACLAGEIPRLILQNNEEKLMKSINRYRDIFGSENFFLELQDHPEIENQMIVNKKIKELAKRNNIPLIATNDVHYIKKNDQETHDVLLCIQTGKSVQDADRMKYEGDYSLRSPEDIAETFSDVPEAVSNTLAIAERCSLDIKFGQDLLPAYKTPQNTSPKEYLKSLCYEGIKKKYGEDMIEKAKKQLDYELSVVDEMGFNTYFLIVHDFVRFAKDSKILVGPGRGSAAGSIIAYSLDITEVDPLKYGLIFERFLNPERISMPDIDIDFADSRRDEVLEYVIEKYGRENVAQIITFGTMTAKAVVRDTGRALGYPYSEVDRLAKLVPPTVLGKHAPLKDSIKNDRELNEVYENEERAKKLLDLAAKLDGTVRHAGTHACAVVISDDDLVKFSPLQRSPTDRETIITQYSMKPVEDIGLLKMDFLGLKNLTLLETAIKIIKRTKGVDIDIENIPLNDKEAFELLQQGNTSGVFQLESAGMKRYLKQLKPTQLEDIIAMISLYRPGPMEWIPAFIKGKHNPSKVKYLHPTFEEILKETNGVAIYQEQILQIAQKFAGYSLGEADILRKAVGKKIPALLNEQRKKFVEGAVNMGHKEKFAEEVFDKVILPFAGYGFNKAHATSYAMISYQTAYLKANYPTEFMTALLSCDYGNTDKIVLEIQECENMGIDVLPPSINESFRNFTYTDESTIRFGLAAIKGIGDEAARVIIESRKESPFKNLEDFASRVPQKILNKKTIEALSYSGALDEFGDRKQIAESTEEIANFSRYHHKTSVDGQTDIFGMLEEEPESQLVQFALKDVEKATNKEKLKWEKDYLGLYVTSHPLNGLKKYFSKKAKLIKDISKKDLGKKIKLGGLITNYRKIFTKSGMYMATFVIEDPTGKFDVIVFPKAYQNYGHILNEDEIVVMTGKINERRGQYQFVCDEAKAIKLERMIENAKNHNLYNTDEKVVHETPPLLKQDEKEDSEETKEKNNDNDSPFVIALPADCPPETLREIKQLLLKCKGEKPCEIHIRCGDRLRRIKVPFGIDANETLKIKIDKMIE